MRFYFTIRMDVKKQVDVHTLNNLLEEAIEGVCSKKEVGLGSLYISYVRAPIDQHVVSAIDTIVEHSRCTARKAVE